MAENEGKVESKKNGGEPEGQGWVNARAEQSGAFFEVKKGASIQGILLGRYPKAGRRKGFFYQIKTTQPCEAKVRDEDGGYTLEDVDVGTIVSIDERTALEGLAKLVDAADEDFNEWEVFIRAEEKRKLSSGNEFWDFTVRKRVVPTPF